MLLLQSVALVGKMSVDDKITAYCQTNMVKM